MKLYFDNSGVFNQTHVKSPVLINDVCMGFIEEVTDERVTMHIFKNISI